MSSKGIPQSGVPNAAASTRAGLRRGLALAVSALVGVGLALSLALALRESWAPLRVSLLVRGAGWCAASALLASLCVSPLSRIARLSGRPSPALSRALVAAPALRRTLGMASAWVALLHLGLTESLQLGVRLQALRASPQLQAGSAALLILSALLLTSFSRLVALLRLRSFRALHRLAFLAALLTLQHVLLSPFAPTRLALGLFGACAVIGLARLLPRASRKAPTGTGGGTGRA